MTTNKQVLSVIFFLLLTQVLTAQWKVVDSSERTKPSWISNTPVGENYNYYSGIGSSITSLEQAHESAVADVVHKIVQEGSFTATVESRTQVGENIRSTSSGDIFEITDDFLKEVTQTGTSKLVIGLQEEETFWQSVQRSSGVEYQYWVLLKVLKPGMQPVEITRHEYGIDPVWRSVLIPGWGQYYKGEIPKSRKILLSESVLISTSVVAFYFSSNYNHKAEDEYDLDNKSVYMDWSNRAHTIGTVTGVMAGTIHIFNIFDAVTAKGAKKYAGKVDDEIRLYASAGEKKITINLTLPL